MDGASVFDFRREEQVLERQQKTPYSVIGDRVHTKIRCSQLESGEKGGEDRLVDSSRLALRSLRG